ncbi:MAG: hypothetical protein J6U74_00420 [Clostridia bacterium]|nr:hypothetical protein [Clostridia bacterium]
MKKGLTYYSIAWAICLVVFNVLTFVMPHAVGNFDWYQHPTFWIGYGFVMLSFIAQLLVGIKMFASEKAERIFLRLSLQSTSYIALFASLVVGAVFMTIPVLPEWIAAIVCVVVTGYYVLAYLKGSAAIDFVEKVGENVKNKTALMRELISESESLMAYAKTDVAKDSTKKVYEALRYSDPMSNDKLYYVEKEISEAYIIFADKVKNIVDEGLDEQADRLCILINDRNNKCKLLK